MAKVAVERRVVAEGDGWVVADIVCNAGPEDRPFEEQHGSVAIAIVTGGTFQYRTGRTPELMTPGSFLLGVPGMAFECSHEHGVGDRCLSFQFTEEGFERVAGAPPRFRGGRVPPLRETAGLIARVLCHPERERGSWVGGRGTDRDSERHRPPRSLAALGMTWGEIAVDVAGTIARIAHERGSTSATPHAVARVAHAVRTLEQQLDAPWSLNDLAAEARLSPYHFLRTFTQVAGVSPHQFALRSRLREAARRLASTDALIIDVALDCGFGDVSNFNRMFRAEYGVAPRGFRQRHQRVGYVPSTFTASAI